LASFGRWPDTEHRVRASPPTQGLAYGRLPGTFAEVSGAANDPPPSVQPPYPALAVLVAHRCVVMCVLDAGKQRVQCRPGVD
jgi:hypothetical protein